MIDMTSAAFAITQARPPFNRLSLIACVAVSAFASLTLFGWATKLDVLTTVFPGMTTMKANTAAALLVAALSVGHLSRTPSRRSNRLDLIGGLFVFLIGLATIAEYVFGINLRIDEALFIDAATTSAPFNGRMSPITALAFVFLGAAILLLVNGRGWRIVAAHLMVLPAAAMGSLSLVGYAYGVERLYHFGPFVSVAINTAMSLCALSVAIVMIRPDEGWRRPLADRPAARAVLMRLLPWSVLVPFLTGLVVLCGVRADFYDARFGLAIFAVATGCAFVWLSWTAAGVARQAEADLAVSEARFRQIAEALPNMVFIADATGKNTYTNSTFQAFTGSPAADLLGDGWARVVHKNDMDVTLQMWQRAVATGTPYEMEYRLRRHDGAYIFHLGRGLPLRDETGRITAWFGTCTDIQDMVDAREALNRTNEDLEAKVAARSAEIAQLQKMEAIGQLTGGIAHDFNNLLTPIVAGLDALDRKYSANERDARMIGGALQSAERARVLVQRLLSFARRQHLQICAVDLGALVIGMSELIDRSLGPQIDVHLAVLPDLPEAYVDPNQLELALLNLAVNARDAMPDGGTLTIGLDAAEFAMAEGELGPGRYLLLTMRDTGTGMSAETLARAIEPFFSTKGLGKGTGLGLSMVHGLAAQSGGMLTLKSAPGAGTTASLWLPIAAEPCDQPVMPPDR